MRPTDGFAPATTSTIASSSSTGAPPGAPPAARRAAATGPAGTSSGAQTSQHGTARRAAPRASPKWRRIVAPAARVALDERPHRAVLAPAGALRLARRGAAGGPRAAVERRGEAAAHAVDRRRRGLDHARAREVADDRPHLLGVAAEVVDAEVVRRARIAEGQRERARGARQALGHARERGVVDLGALDEEDVQPLVARLGEQQRSRRRAVASRAARLLVVGLDRPGHARVRDGSHVGLVDAHAEGVGGDDDLDLAAP